MLKNVLILGALIISLIGIICVFSARKIVKNKLNYGEENDVVTGMKIFGWLLVILMFATIYFI